MTKKTFLKTSRILPQTYSTQTKEQNKAVFIKNKGLPIPTSKRSMLLALSLNPKEDTPENLMKEELLLALEANKMYTIVIGENPHPTHFKYVFFVDPLYTREVQQIADLYIWPEREKEPSIMHHGTVCISQYNDYVDQYDPQKEIGCGFVSRLSSHWTLFADIIRAEESYKFIYDWKHICQNAMDRSYIDL